MNRPTAINLKAAFLGLKPLINVGSFCQVRFFSQTLNIPISTILVYKQNKYQTLPLGHSPGHSTRTICAAPYSTLNDRKDGNMGCNTRTANQERFDYVSSWTTESTLYVHWPYCEKRCTYCNFNKYISKTVDHKRMRDCLVQETKSLIQQSHVKRIKSLFFGGGTPSLALPSTIESVISTVRNMVQLHDDAEITLEVNPTSTEIANLQDFKNAGVNRISLGIQTLEQEGLELLGRQHSVSEALWCLEGAKSLFPGRVSVDLMFGRPGQTLSAWDSELENIIRICDDHLSLYQLTLERGTALFKQVTAGILALPDVDQMADMYKLAVDKLEEHGFRRYEASNFARNGAESIHNQAYWSGSQYIGVGPGAHGRFALRASPEVLRWAFTQTLEPTPWMVEVGRNGHATRRAVPQSTLLVLEEIIMLGMRTTNGVSQTTWQTLGGRIPLVELFSQDAYVNELQKLNLLVLDEMGLRATQDGLNLADNITASLLHVLQQSKLSELSHISPSGQEL